LTFLNDLSGSKADHIVIVVDACHAGNLIDTLDNPLAVRRDDKGQVIETYQLTPEQRAKITIIVAAQTSEESQSHFYSGGEFTFRFLQAIQDLQKKDQNHEGVFLDEALNNVSKTLGGGSWKFTRQTAGDLHIKVRDPIGKTKEVIE